MSATFVCDRWPAAADVIEQLGMNVDVVDPDVPVPMIATPTRFGDVVAELLSIHLAAR